MNDPINQVKIGDYCILKNPLSPSKDLNKINLNDKIFVRDIIDDRELWLLKSKLKIAEFLNE